MKEFLRKYKRMDFILWSGVFNLVLLPGTHRHIRLSHHARAF